MPGAHTRLQAEVWDGAGQPDNTGRPPEAVGLRPLAIADRPQAATAEGQLVRWQPPQAKDQPLAGGRPAQGEEGPARWQRTVSSGRRPMPARPGPALPQLAVEGRTGRNKSPRGANDGPAPPRLAVEDRTGRNKAPRGANKITSHHPPEPAGPGVGLSARLERPVPAACGLPRSEPAFAPA